MTMLDTFIIEMRKMLHLSDDYEITTSVRTDELGLDSLVAVRIRSWFLNNYQVNIPALRILKGTSLQELIGQAVEDIPDELTPNISSNEDLQSEVKAASSSYSSSINTSDRTDTLPSSGQQTEASSIHEELDFQEHLEDVKPQEVELKRFGRLSYTQSVFLFVHELLNDKSTLNNTGMLHLRGEIRIADLAKDVRALGQRHEALRTCICEQDGKLVQGVLESTSLVLEYKRVYAQEDLFKEYASLRNHVFDLSRGRTSRVILLSYSSMDHYLLMGSHHIIFDRASNDAVMADLERAYNGLQLGPDPLQYLDYSNQQHDQYFSGGWKEAINFWRHEFDVLPDSLPLHRSQVSKRRPLERYASHIPEFRINRQLSGKIREVARKYRSTPFHFHLAAFKVLLHRFLGTRDVCIGIADNCRRDDYMRTGIGPFLNMLPLRMNASAEQSFGEAIVEAREKSLLVLTNAIPFEVILNELQVIRPSTHTPLAQAFMNYAENDVEDGQLFLGCRMETMNQNPAEIPYDITFTVVNNTAGDTRIILNVQESLYSEEDTMLIAHGYEDILQEFATGPEEQIGDDWQFRKAVLEKALTIGRGE
jgi:hybrid polyketide synthase/nonribosomal peptide synthetase ACE1